jgi:hypothetical protein
MTGPGAWAHRHAYWEVRWQASPTNSSTTPHSAAINRYILDLEADSTNGELLVPTTFSSPPSVLESERLCFKYRTPCNHVVCNP